MTIFDLVFPAGVLFALFLTGRAAVLAVMGRWSAPLKTARLPGLCLAG